MSDQPPAVAVLPYGMKLGVRPGNISLDALNWPKGQPARYKGGRLDDLEATDHLIVYPRKSHHWRLGFGTKAQVSIMVVEPRVIHGHHMDRLLSTHKRFFRVFSCDRAFLKSVPNGEFLVFGTSWVPDWETLDTTKSKDISLIASAKRSQEGHRLRHALVDWMRAQGIQGDFLGGGYAPFDKKSDGLAPYRYSVVIENIREESYFTEKLVDALLCETVPIYWGCPNIHEFFDPDCMIICEDEQQMQQAILNASETDYQKRLPKLRGVKQEVAKYIDLEARAVDALLASI